MIVELTNEEINTLIGVLLVEKNELKELIKKEVNLRDKTSLKEEYAKVESMLNKITK